MSDTTDQKDQTNTEEYPMARPATQAVPPATYASVSAPSSTVTNTSTSTCKLTWHLTVLDGD